MNRKYLNSCSSYLILLIFIFLIINDDDGGSSCGGTCCHGSVVVEKDDYNIEEANTLLVPMEGAGSAQSFLHPGVSKTETNILGSAPSSDIRYSFPVTPGMTKQDYKCTYLRFDMNIGIDPGQFSSVFYSYQFYLVGARPSLGVVGLQTNGGAKNRFMFGLFASEYGDPGDGGVCRATNGTIEGIAFTHGGTNKSEVTSQCAVVRNWIQNHTYSFTLRMLPNSMLSTFVKDLNSDERSMFMGQIFHNADFISPYTAYAWVQYYEVVSPNANCFNQPLSEVYLGPPICTTPSGVVIEGATAQFDKGICPEQTVVSAKGNGTSHLLAKDNSVRGTINMTAIILPLINKISSQGMACLDTLAGLPGKPDYAYLVECSDRRTQHYVMSSMDNSIRTTSNLCVSICNITRVTRGGPCCMNRCESNVDPASTPLTQQWKLLPLNYTHTRLQSAMNASLCLTAVSPLTPRNPYDRAEPPILTLQLCQQTNDPEFLSYSSHHQIWAIPFNLDRLAQQRKLEEETKTKKMEVLNN